MSTREQLQADALIVGAGPAGLACAYRLADLSKGRGWNREILVLEKGQEAGQHILSGAVMDPRGLKGLLGDGWRQMGCPVEADVERETVYYLTARRKFRFPWVPPTLRNHGGVVVALSRVVEWLKGLVEAQGVNILSGFPAEAPILNGSRLEGVVIADRGLDRSGKPKPGFQAGAEIRAPVTLLAEGSRGSITKILVEKLGLAGRNPQTYGLGVKEVWEVPPGRIAPGEVIHTAGWPLAHGHYGGGWIYGLRESRVSIGFVPALDSPDPTFDAHEATQRWKTHPLLRDLLAGGKLLQAGAKTVPEGGFWSQPHLWGNGFLIAGDAGSFLNAPRLKGIHTAIRSGELAALAMDEVLELDDTSAAALVRYGQFYREDWLRQELQKVRNVRQAFNGFHFPGGFFLGAIRAGMMLMCGGRLLADCVKVKADHEHVRRAQKPGTAPGSSQGTFRPDGVLTIDKLTAVFHAGSMHEENQPSHLVVADTDLCRTRCAEEYGNPCQHFCPAKVYEMEPDPDPGHGPNGKRLRINHSNCVHCKTCDVMDPYQVITWKVPGDAGGPKYLGL